MIVKVESSLHLFNKVPTKSRPDVSSSIVAAGVDGWYAWTEIRGNDPAPKEVVDESGVKNTLSGALCNHSKLVGVDKESGVPERPILLIATTWNV